MRTSLLLTAASLFAFALSVNLASAQAQKSMGSRILYASAATISGSDGPGQPVSKVRASKVAVKAVALEAPKTTTRVITGHVASPQGMLPGAVVEVVGTQLSAVANADGEFSLTLPAHNGSPVQVLVSYAGYADETPTIIPGNQPAILTLATLQEIKIAHRQQMKAYSKTAKRQVKRSLRQP